MGVSQKKITDSSSVHFKWPTFWVSHISIRMFIGDFSWWKMKYFPMDPYALSDGIPMHMHRRQLFIKGILKNIGCN